MVSHVFPSNPHAKNDIAWPITRELIGKQLLPSWFEEHYLSIPKRLYHTASPCSCIAANEACFFPPCRFLLISFVSDWEQMALPSVTKQNLALTVPSKSSLHWSYSPYVLVLHSSSWTEAPFWVPRHGSFALRNFNLERAAFLVLFRHDCFSQAKLFMAFLIAGFSIPGSVRSVIFSIYKQKF